MKQLNRWMRIVGGIHVVNGFGLIVRYLQTSGLREALVTQAAQKRIRPIPLRGEAWMSG